MNGRRIAELLADLGRAASHSRAYRRVVSEFTEEVMDDIPRSGGVHPLDTRAGARAFARPLYNFISEGLDSNNPAFASRIGRIAFIKDTIRESGVNWRDSEIDRIARRWEADMSTRYQARVRAADVSSPSPRGRVADIEVVSPEAAAAARRAERAAVLREGVEEYGDDVSRGLTTALETGEVTPELLADAGRLADHHRALGLSSRHPTADGYQTAAEVVEAIKNGQGVSPRLLDDLPNMIERDAAAATARQTAEAAARTAGRAADGAEMTPSAIPEQQRLDIKERILSFVEGRSDDVDQFEADLTQISDETLTRALDPGRARAAAPASDLEGSLNRFTNDRSIDPGDVARIREAGRPRVAEVRAQRAAQAEADIAARAEREAADAGADVARLAPAEEVAADIISNIRGGGRFDIREAFTNLRAAMRQEGTLVTGEPTRASAIQTLGRLTTATPENPITTGDLQHLQDMAQKHFRIGRVNAEGQPQLGVMGNAANAVHNSPFGLVTRPLAWLTTGRQPSADSVRSGLIQSSGRAMDMYLPNGVSGPAKLVAGVSAFGTAAALGFASPSEPVDYSQRDDVPAALRNADEGTYVAAARDILYPDPRSGSLFGDIFNTAYYTFDYQPGDGVETLAESRLKGAYDNDPVNVGAAIEARYKELEAAGVTMPGFLSEAYQYMSRNKIEADRVAGEADLAEAERNKNEELARRTDAYTGAIGSTSIDMTGSTASSGPGASLESIEGKARTAFSQHVTDPNQLTSLTNAFMGLVRQAAGPDEVLSTEETQSMLSPSGQGNLESLYNRYNVPVNQETFNETVTILRP